jgi:hypothetical protein
MGDMLALIQERNHKGPTIVLKLAWEYKPFIILASMQKAVVVEAYQL